MDNDLNLDIRKAAKELNVREKKLILYLVNQKYVYRHNVSNKLKPYIEYTKMSKKYFKEIWIINTKGLKKRSMVFTEEGIKFFKSKSKEIDEKKIIVFINKCINFLKNKVTKINREI